MSASVRALRSIHRPGFNYVKAGAMLGHLHSPGHVQSTLDSFGSDELAPPPAQGRTGSTSALDALNEQFGRQAVTVANATRKDWPSADASLQKRRSPRYTTRLEEIVTVRS